MDAFQVQTGFSVRSIIYHWNLIELVIMARISDMFIDLWRWFFGSDIPLMFKHSFFDLSSRLSHILCITIATINSVNYASFFMCSFLVFQFTKFCSQFPCWFVRNFHIIFTEDSFQPFWSTWYVWNWKKWFLFCLWFVINLCSLAISTEFTFSLLFRLLDHASGIATVLKNIWGMVNFFFSEFGVR